MNHINPPSLSIVVVSTDNYETISRTIRHLSTQTIQDRLEIIIVTWSAVGLGLDTKAMEGFYGFQVVEVGAISSIDRAYASGIRRANANVIALVEDHAYPAPNWAEVLVEAHQGPWSVIGSAIANANPRNMLSWINLLVGYGPWLDPARGGEVQSLPFHNVSYKRDVLREYDAVLEDILEQKSGFIQALKTKGHRLYLAPNTRVYHLNPSQLIPMMTLRFLGGRLYGATRAENEHWSLLRRLFYIGATPLIPLVRLRRLMSELFGDGQRNDLLPQILPALMIGLIADAIGQAVGYAFGAGDSLRKISDSEMNRLSHVTEWDRKALRF